MIEARRRGAAQQTRQADLPSGGIEQVLAAHDQIDAVAHVVHGDRKLVGPLAVTVSEQQVAALPRGLLFARAEEAVFERFFAAAPFQPQAVRGAARMVRRAAAPSVDAFARPACRAMSGEVFPRADAAIDVMTAPQPAERFPVNRVRVALAVVRRYRVLGFESPASPGLRGSPPRIPRGSAAGRGLRCAAARARPASRPAPIRRARARRGPGGAAPSGWARNASPAAAVSRVLPTAQTGG